jgi:4'-phosphopantetheinyl transferase
VRRTNPDAMAASGTWPAPEETPLLAETAVHVWRASLDLSPPRLADLAVVLDDEERARAARFHFEPDRRRFVAAHGLLRRTLARYLDVDPRSIRYQSGPYGKPSLADHDQLDLRFNLAHSGKIALVAVGIGREIGVDVELIRPDIVTLDVAKQFFAPGEVRALGSLPAAERTGAFFCCWTRKEAYIKARGEGLSAPLDSFEVSVRPVEPAALVWCAAGDEERVRWSLRALDVSSEYAGAVAAEGHDWTLFCWDADRWLI